MVRGGTRWYPTRIFTFRQPSSEIDNFEASEWLAMVPDGTRRFDQERDALENIDGGN